MTFHLTSPLCRALLVIALGAFSSCEKPALPAWAPGVVFALDGLPITAEEIDAAADIIAQLEPDSVATQARRIALTNMVLPRAAGILAAGEEREKARQRALEFRRALVGGATLSGPMLGGLMQTREGVAPEIGLDAWSYASTAADGVWSEPIETVGAFEVVCVEARSNAGSARQVRYKVRICVVPYVDENDIRGVIEARLDRSKLVFVDPTWEEIVPETWKHRLHVGAP